MHLLMFIGPLAIQLFELVYCESKLFFVLYVPVLSSRDIDFLEKFPILTFFCKKSARFKQHFVKPL